MDSRGFSQLSGYRIMWIWVLFDLPVGTKAERKRALRFRKDLLGLGFEMVQFSVYLRHAWSMEKAESYARKVGAAVPEAGHVQIHFFTDKQYAQCRIFRSGIRGPKPKEKPELLALF